MIPRSVSALRRSTAGDFCTLGAVLQAKVVQVGHILQQKLSYPPNFKLLLDEISFVLYSCYTAIQHVQNEFGKENTMNKATYDL